MHNSDIVNFAGTTDKRLGKGSNRRLKPAAEVFRGKKLKTKRAPDPTPSRPFWSSTAPWAAKTTPTRMAATSSGSSQASSVDNPSHITASGRPRKTCDNLLITQLLDHFGNRRARQGTLDPLKIKQGDSDWMDYRVGKISGSLASAVLSRGAGAVGAAVLALQLNAPYSNAAMRRGIFLEKLVIENYFKDKNVNYHYYYYYYFYYY
jgi:hypothetical protein